MNASLEVPRRPVPLYGLAIPIGFGFCAGIATAGGPHGSGPCLARRYLLGDAGPLDAGQEPGEQAEQRQEGADAVDGGDAREVGELAQQGGADGAEAEGHPVEQAGRGDTVGELRFFGGKDAREQLRAVRPSVVVGFSAPEFEALLAGRPGILRSVTRQPSRIDGATARNAVADSCRRTVKPAVASRKASDLRTGSSSSTTCTV